MHCNGSHHQSIMAVQYGADCRCAKQSQSTGSAAHYNIKHTFVRTVAKQRMIMQFVSCVSHHTLHRHVLYHELYTEIILTKHHRMKSFCNVRVHIQKESDHTSSSFRIQNKCFVDTPFPQIVYFKPSQANHVIQTKTIKQTKISLSNGYNCFENQVEITLKS